MCSSESLCKPSISLLSDGRWWPATLQKYKGQQKRNPLSRKWQNKPPDLNAVLWPHVCAVSHIYLYLHIGIHAHTSTHIVKCWEKKPAMSCLEVVFESGVFKKSQGQMRSSGWCLPHGIRDFIIKLKIFTVFLRDTFCHGSRRPLPDTNAALGLICLQGYKAQKPFSFISYQDIGI